jgi:hypothetical protein
MKGLIIAIIKVLTSWVGGEVTITKQPSALEYRVVRNYGKFYIEMETNSGHWLDVHFNDGGNVSVPSSYGFMPFETSQEACDIVKKLNAGQSYFEEYDKRGYAVIDCDCQEKPSEQTGSV